MWVALFISIKPGNDGIHHHGPGHQSYPSHAQPSDIEPDNSYHHDNIELYFC